jgi:hypothetical protein
MSTITATSGQPIRVGRKLDNKAVSVTFDLETLCTEYSPEEVKLAVKRDGDDIAYYASGWTMDGSTGTWIPTSVDLARHSCLVQPILFAADDVVAHGEVFRCIISRSIDDETGDVPAVQSLLIEIGRVSDKADEAISTATQAAEDASTAADQASTAYSLASDVSQTATSAQTAAQAAQTAAQSASETATTASQTATSAQSAANSAKNIAMSASYAASDAKGTAESAEVTAQSAYNTASTAQSTAESAQSTAQSASETASTASSAASQLSTRMTAAEGDIDDLEKKFINPNMSSFREIVCWMQGSKGKIIKSLSSLATVEEGKTYTLSFDIVKALTGDVEGCITDKGGTVSHDVFTIVARDYTGHGALSFTAPATGTVWMRADLGAGWHNYEIVLDHVQLEEGSTPTSYVPSGLSPLVDGVCRENLSEFITGLKKGMNRYLNDVICCAAANGYTVLGDDPASIEAMTQAKIRGFDLVEVALYNDSGQIYVCHADRTKSDITLETAVRHCAKIGIGMCVAVGYGDTWTQDICRHLSKVLTTHRMPHVYAQADSVSLLTYLRNREPLADIVVFYGSAFPTVADLRDSATYTDLRALATSGTALTSICVKTSAGTVDDAYADGCADLGLGLVGGPEETTEALQSHIQYYNLIVGQKRTSDIYTVIT